jgi:hypothetical protein
MIQIEKVTNGYILRIEEDEEDSTIVFQKEYDSLNVALGSVCNYLIKMYSEPSEVQLKVDIIP